MSLLSTFTTVLITGGLLTGCFLDALPAYDDDGSGVVGTTPDVRALALGPTVSCAILTSGGVRCWGTPPVGLGGVVGAQALRPVMIAELAGVDALAPASNHGCVAIAGAVSCYGDNEQGQLGTGQAGGSDLPLQAALGVTSVAQLSLAASTNLARTTSGSVLAWGAAFVGTGMPTPMVVDGLDAVSDVSNGGDHHCAVHGGSVSCWGWNTGGQLGRGTVPGPNTQTVEAPGPVLGVTDAIQVIAGRFNCVVHAGGTVSCWGQGSANPAQPTPTLVPGLVGVKALTQGAGHACALMTTGTLACWGSNMGGALGLGPDSTYEIAPVLVPGLADLVEVAASGSSTCARHRDGQISCWGSTVPGDGSSTSSPVPVIVRW